MEKVNYTNFKVDEHVYGKNEVCGLIDRTGNFLYETLYDIKSPIYNGNLPVAFYLKFGTQNKNLVQELMSELGIEKTLYKRPLKKLSSSELIKVLTIKVATSSASTIILNSIDAYLTDSDLKNLLKVLKTHQKEINKTVIFTTNKPDNILTTERYLVADSGNIIYNGNDISKLPVDTETILFAKMANKKGAKLNYYKEVNDLLKAIYRSVK